MATANVNVAGDGALFLEMKIALHPQDTYCFVC